MKKSVTKRTSGKQPSKKPAKQLARASAEKARAAEIDPAFAPVAAAFANDREVGLGRMFSSS
jgi:beta-glucosidase-like glycosyl hydrolase